MPCTRTACRTAAVFTSRRPPSVNCPPALTWTPSPSSTPVTPPGLAPWRRGRGSADTSSTPSGGPRTSPGSASISPTPGTSTDSACSELVAVIANYLFKLFTINSTMNWFILIVNYINFHSELISFSCELFILWTVLFLDSLCQDTIVMSIYFK